MPPDALVVARSVQVNAINAGISLAARREVSVSNDQRKHENAEILSKKSKFAITFFSNEALGRISEVAAVQVHSKNN